jgi:NADH-quinone oxidoreductase subunit N
MCVFLVSIRFNNLFSLFIIFELVTLLIVVIITTYLVSIGSKFLQPVLYFFILNVFIAAFFIFGTVMHLYIILPNGGATLNYSSLIFFKEVLSSLDNSEAFNVYSQVFTCFFLITFFFKLTIAPFSIWVANIYRQLPFIFLVLLMTIYKFVFFLLFIALFVSTISSLPEHSVLFTQLSTIVTIPSLLIGCLAFRTQDFKLMLAYTTVSQMGYVTAGLCSGDAQAGTYSLYYLVFYCFQLLGLLAIILKMKPYCSIISSNQFFLVQHYNKTYAFFLMLLFFNIAGIPPLSGFFFKY